MRQRPPEVSEIVQSSVAVLVIAAIAECSCAHVTVPLFRAREARAQEKGDHNMGANVHCNFSRAAQALY